MSTAMSSYLSSPNDSRNNRVIKKLTLSRNIFLFPFFFPFCRHVNSRRAHDRHTRYDIFFYRGTHSGCYREYCLLSRDLYAFTIFPSCDWARQGLAGKIQVRGVIGRYTLETSAYGYTQCERHLSQHSLRGKFYSAHDVARFIADITFPAYFSL